MSDRSARQQNSRAEQLRQKRQQPVRVPVMPTKKTTTEPVHKQVVNPFGKKTATLPQPPAKQAAVITTHTTSYSTPLRQSVAIPARRRMYHVDKRGVETRLPVVPMLKFSWQWISGLMTVMLVIMAILLVALPVFKVSQVQVEGLQRVTQADIQRVIQANSTSIFTLDRQKLVGAIAVAFPELRNIRLKVDPSGVVLVSAEERQPVLAWKAGDYHFWFDAAGVVMDARGDTDALLTINSDGGVPMIKITATESTARNWLDSLFDREENETNPDNLINALDPVVMKAAFDLSTQMPAGSILVYDSVSGMGWQDPRGWKVYFGLSLEDMQFKLTAYQSIAERLIEMGITPSVISVAHIDSPFYRTK